MLLSSVAHADADAEFQQAIDILTVYKNSNQEYKKAFEIGESLDQQGHCGGGFILGRMYVEGYGVIKDANKGKDLLFKSANSGCETSMSYIGFDYVQLHTLGLPTDFIKAETWINKSYEININKNKKVIACFQARRFAEIYNDNQMYPQTLEWYQKVKNSGISSCADDKTLRKISELEKSVQKQTEAMREDPPVAGITLSLGGDDAKPAKKSKKKK